MELLLAQIAQRCLLDATRARRALAWARVHGDVQGITAAEGDLAFAGTVARAIVVALHERPPGGGVDGMTVAQVGVDLVETLRLISGAELGRSMTSLTEGRWPS